MLDLNRSLLFSAFTICILLTGCSSGTSTGSTVTSPPPTTPTVTPTAPTATPSTLTFSSMQIGTTSAAQVVTVIPQSGDAITAKSSNPTVFILTTNSCAQGSATCRIGISFAPNVAGAVTGQLLLTDSNGLTATITLSGTGFTLPVVPIPPAPSSPTATPSTLTFSSTQIGTTSAAQVVKVIPQSGDAITAKSSSPTVFVLSTNSCAQGAATCQIGVSFSPSVVGAITGQFIITDSNGLTATVALSGVGFVPPVVPVVSTSHLDFGNQEIGIASAAQTITVSAQNADAVTMQLQSSGNFTVTPSSSCTASGTVCQIAVGFNPSIDGAISTNLVVTDTVNSLASTITLTGIGYGNPGAMSGLAYYLPFTDLSGATIQDVSGNGKNATISGAGTAAVWLSNVGLQLNGKVATIPNASGLPTFGYCAYFPAATASSFSRYLYDISYAVGGQNGYDIDGSYGIGTDHGPYAYFPQIGRSNGASPTLSSAGISGNHCVEAIVGSSSSGTLDRIFVDGVEVNYIGQGITDDTLGSGQLMNAMNLQVSVSGGSGFRLPITHYSVWAAASRDTPGQATARAKSEIARLTGLGVQFGFPVLSDTDSSCSITGTSLDTGYYASHTPSALLNLGFPCTIHNLAVSGQPPADMTAGYEDREATIYHPKAAKNIAFNGGPTNGVINDQESPAKAFQNLLDWNTLAHSQGWKTLVETMTSRCDQTGYMGETGDALKQQYNALLLANADLFDWVINQAAAPQIGADNACTNLTYFADRVHFTDAGQAFYVAAERAGFEGVYRSTSTSISADYTQIASDAVIIASGAKPITVLLVDANTGNFNKNGRVCVSNAGTATVTLEAVSGETVGGSQTLPVATGIQLCFMPTVADPSVAGAVWSIVP